MASGDNWVSKADLLSVLKRLTAARAFAGHHINSFNDFIGFGIASIVSQGFAVTRRIKNRRSNTAADNEISEISYSLEFRKVQLDSPMRNDPTVALYGARAIQSAKRAERADGEGKASSAPRAAMVDINANSILLPSTARALGRTYSAALRIDADITATAHREGQQPLVKTERITNLRIGAIPCMVGSSHCHLAGKSRQELIELGEDPNDVRAYFIIRGGEWSLDIIENITMNDIRVTTEHAGSEIARAQIWCKAGDNFENSYQFIVRLMANGGIMIEFQYSSQIKLNIPFATFFRLIADITDEAIVKTIVDDYESRDPLTVAIVGILNRAFMAPISTAEGEPYEDLRNCQSHAKIVADIGSYVNELSKNAAAGKDVNVMRTVYAAMMAAVDTRIVPHIGTRERDRPRKQQYIGYAISKLLLTHLGVLNPLDRDSLRFKRMSPAGIAIAKSFKTMFNHSVVAPMTKHIESAFEAAPFSEVVMASTIAGAIKADDLENAMVRSITAGNTTITMLHRSIPNRVSSQMRYLKNDANALAIAGTISVANVISNKQNERADMIRRVHPTYIGYIDVSHSADSGEKVGMNKQIGITAIISSAVSSANLREVIEKEEGAALIKDVPAGHSGRLSRVLVNGNWIGSCDRDHEFVARWRAKRRQADSPLIHKHTSIYWDPRSREVQFWTDYGRMLRPLLIVENNYEEYDAKCRAAFAAKKPLPDRSEFKQWLRLNAAHAAAIVSGRMDLDAMIREGLIEYIAADEAENILVASNIDVLHDHRNDLCVRYTHCEIEQSIFGILSLAAPLVNHSYAYRVTLGVCHRKQFCTWYSLAYPHRIDKQTIHQYYNERAIVKTLSDDILNPSGHNAIVAIMLYGGHNQQDSLVVNKSSVDRGLFNGTFFNFSSAVREKGEEFALPRDQVVVDRDNDAVADFLEDGVAKVGTVLRQNYIIIAKTAVSTDRRGATGGTPTAVDRSVIYKNKTPAYVVRVIRDDGDKKMASVRVKWRQVKHLISGDKSGSRTGNKGIVAKLEAACNMPFAEDGTVPDVIVNAQSIPTRRALNQLVESLLGNYAAAVGCHVDATSFLPVDVDAVIAELEKRGFKYAGYRRMYNGNTGDWIDTPICIGPTCYQRMQKFADNESYAIRHGPTNALTRQPIRGRNEGGSLRVGEMEMDVLMTHGTMSAATAKMFDDSDGTHIYVCAKCGERAIYNQAMQIYNCARCREYANIARVPSCWASNLYQHEVRGLGIKMTYELEPEQFYVPLPPQ